MVLIRRLSFNLFFIFLIFSYCFADGDSFQGVIQELQRRIENLEKIVTQQQQYIIQQQKKEENYEKKIAEYEARLSEVKSIPAELPEKKEILKDLEFQGGATMVMQGTGNINYLEDLATAKKSRTDVSYSLDLEISKDFSESASKLFLHLETTEGMGLEDNLILYSNVNEDADENSEVHLAELWYEKGFLSGRVTTTVGKLDPTAYFDTNEIANDEKSQFLARIFCNSPVVEFPDNGLGVRVSYKLSEMTNLDLGLFEGDSDWERVGDNLFKIAQLHFKTSIKERLGNYRFYGWHTNTYHTKWLDRDKKKEDNYGFGFSSDQEVSKFFTLFLRCGWQNPKVYNPEVTTVDDRIYSLEHAYSFGIQVKGELWGREKDIFALAFGQVIPSKYYKKYDDGSGLKLRAKAEGHLEAYYKITLNEHLSLSPDLQYIWNPFGKDVQENTKDIFIGGMRAQLDF